MSHRLSGLPRAPARSRDPRRNQGPPDKSASGSGVKRCTCRATDMCIKQVVHNGLQLLRVRYGLPYVELPDCSPDELSRLLSFLLLQGKERRSVVFPRRQRPGNSIDGLCSLQRLGRRHRWELALSMSSIKRNLPPGCAACTPSRRSSWEGTACSQPPPPSDEYLEHVRRVSAHIFTAGWDSHYRSFVGNYLPNPTARKPLRSRADLLWAGRREEFFNATLRETDLPPSLTARYKEVMSAGKVRPLLIFDEFVDLLGPMHKCMYRHLQGLDWLLCGPPTEERMESTCVREYQTSVDLVNATDGLHHSVIEVILDTAFFSSCWIPRSLRALAKTSYRPLFESRGQLLRVTHGQMMGSYLSFPLLCIQSYCAASWAARFDDKARFLVNGDDCVISASRGITVQDYPHGYRLNSDKTIVSRSVVDVNSTVFLKKQKGGWRLVRHLRRGGAPTDYAGMMHMASAVVAAGPCWVDAFQRARIGRRWGFLPSQIGHWTYAAWLRERQMSRRRTPSSLPDPGSPQDETSLRRIYGRDPRPLESEALRAFLWREGRRGGLKRDEFRPSCGEIRRTYGYRARPCWSFLSFVGPRMRRKLHSPPAARFFLVPDEFETEEEERDLLQLRIFRLALRCQLGTCGVGCPCADQ